jgi:hypothetical protein
MLMRWRASVKVQCLVGQLSLVRYSISIQIIKIRLHPLMSSLQVTRHRFTVVLCYIPVPRSSISKVILCYSDGQKYIIAHGAIKKIFRTSRSILVGLINTYILFNTRSSIAIPKSMSFREVHKVITTLSNPQQ